MMEMGSINQRRYYGSVRGGLECMGVCEDDCDKVCKCETTYEDLSIKKDTGLLNILTLYHNTFLYCKYTFI